MGWGRRIVRSATMLKVARTVLVVGLSAAFVVAAAGQPTGISTRPNIGGSGGGSGSGGASGGAPGSAEAPVQNVDPRRETLMLMMTPITIEFEGNTLEQVVEFIKQVTGADIEIKWLEGRYDTGLDREEIVDLSIKREMPALNVLERVLEQVEDDFDASTWQLTPYGTLEVGPRSRLNRKRTTKVYDIQDLLFTIPDYVDVPDLNIDAILNQSGGGGGRGGGGGSIFDENDGDDKEAPDREGEQQKIIDLIQDLVESDQWEVNGGTGGFIRTLNGNLIIKAPDYIHRQIGGYDFLPGDYIPYRPAKKKAPAPAP